MFSKLESKPFFHYLTICFSPKDPQRRRLQAGHQGQRVPQGAGPDRRLLEHPRPPREPALGAEIDHRTDTDAADRPRRARGRSTRTE